MYAEIFKQLLNTIATALERGATGAADIYTFEWIDIDQGQIDQMEEQYPIPFPAALIDVSDIAWDNAGDDNQVGEATISIRIAMDVPENLNSLTPTTSFNAGLARFTLVGDVYNLIENLNIKTKNFTRFTRVRQFTEKRPDRLKVVTLQFKTTIWDGRPDKRSYTTIARPSPEQHVEL